MAKKRNCRRSYDENAIHVKAVKLRKMTDEQLVHYIEDRAEKARSEGFNQGKKRFPAAETDIPGLIAEIGAIRGVGKVKLKEIEEILISRLGGEQAQATEP